MALELMAAKHWGLRDAYRTAEHLLTAPALIKLLIRALFSADEELRMRAADTARRVTEKNRELLRLHADELIGLLGASGYDNWRTRAHLGLIVGRIAHARAQRLRAAPMLRAAQRCQQCGAVQWHSLPHQIWLEALSAQAQKGYLPIAVANEK